MIKILLVEPNFPIQKKSRNHKNFLPIGLLKIGAYLKQQGALVKLVRGNETIKNYNPDEIWITSLFTYWSKYFWDSVMFYRENYRDSKINVGGIYVSLHYSRKYFKQKCKIYRVKPYFGIYKNAEKCLADYSLIKPNPHPLNYQIIHSTRGCPRHCNFCYTWKLEPKFEAKTGIKNEVCSNKLVFYDNNLLMNKNIINILKEIEGLKYHEKTIRCESQCGFDGRILENKPELAIALKNARFDYPKIAWDGGYADKKHIENQIEIIKRGRYPLKDISVFMIFNWKIPFIEMEKKRLMCWKWKVQITDCRYRPIDRLFDDFNAKLKQTNRDYYIHNNWTDAEVKQFRKNVRRQNICVRHGFPFHSSLLERKGVSKKDSMKLRLLPKQELVNIVSDAWFPGRICKPKRIIKRKKACNQSC
jgi:hypothetical protein